MAGREGARGYVYQVLVAVFKCFQLDEWDQVKVETLTDNDKEDILLKNDKVITNAIQVKSSINKFEKPNLERWIVELRKDIKAINYVLVLIGDDLTEPASKFIKRINGDKDNHICVEVIKKRREGLEQHIKFFILEFLECYRPKCCITLNQLQDIEDKIFSKLMKISTNEEWFSKNDLVNIINSTVDGNINQKKGQGKFNRIIWSVACFGTCYLSIYISKDNIISLLCMIFVNLIIMVIWGLLKYSDMYFWKNLEDDHEYYNSKKYGSLCRSIAVSIYKDNVVDNQRVYIENLLDKRIDYIEGKIKFYRRNVEQNCVYFNGRDIDSRRKVKIDEIHYNTDRNYIDKVGWDEVELCISNIESQDSRACVWKGSIIKVHRLFDSSPFDYLCVGKRRILPYELTWFKDKIINRIRLCIIMFSRPGFWRYRIWTCLKRKSIKKKKSY